MFRRPSAPRRYASTLVLVFLAATMAASGHSRVQRESSLVFTVLALLPSDGMYVEPARGERFVVFQGETVALHLELANMTGGWQPVDTTGLSPSGAFRVISVTGATPPPVLSIAKGHIDRTGFRPAVSWGSVVELEPGSALSWHATFEARGEPGIHRWQLELPPLGTSAPLAVNSSQVAYELRDVRTFGDRAELLRRRMVALFVEDDPAASQAAAELPAFYPNSFEAHMILGRLELEAGRKRAARRHLHAAIRLLTSKRDRLYLDQVRPSIHDTDPVPSLRAELRAIR